jgi:hypothetical protein
MRLRLSGRSWLRPLRHRASAADVIGEMRRGLWQFGAILVLAGLLAAVAGDAGDGSQVRRSAVQGDRSGLELRANLVQAHGTIAVETRVMNRRSRPVHLMPDQCGRVTEVLLRRTRFQPEGARWSASIGALKELIVERQRRDQQPERFAPRRPGRASGEVPECERPRRPVRLAPGAGIHERWELTQSATLDDVGSDHAAVRVEVVEAEGSETTELLDMIRPSGADDRRAGRNLRVETPAAAVIDHPPRTADVAPSIAMRFDELLADDRLRSWIAARVPSSWRHASMGEWNGELRLEAITTEYERAVTATARLGDPGIAVEFPSAGDRAHAFPSRPVSLPPGIRVIDEPEAAIPTRDIVPGRIDLPSGRLVAAGDGFFEGDVVSHRVTPGAHPVHITLARRPREDFEVPALATLVISNRKTLTWKEAGAIGTDGATGGFTSAEGAKAFRRLDEAGWERWTERATASIIAHDCTPPGSSRSTIRPTPFSSIPVPATAAIRCSWVSMTRAARHASSSISS